MFVRPQVMCNFCRVFIPTEFEFLVGGYTLEPYKDPQTGVDMYSFDNEAKGDIHLCKRCWELLHKSFAAIPR